MAKAIKRSLKPSPAVPEPPTHTPVPPTATCSRCGRPGHGADDPLCPPHVASVATEDAAPPTRSPEGQSKRKATFKAMETLSIQGRSDLLRLCVGRLYDAQKLRIQSGLRIGQIERDGSVLPSLLEGILTEAIRLEEAAESEYELIVAKLIEPLPIYTHFLSGVKGIGPRLSGLLIALIRHPGLYATTAKLWAYSGYHTRDGLSVRRTKGVRSNWNPLLKTTCWKAACSFLKCGSPYALNIYAPYKKRITERTLNLGFTIYKSDPTGSKFTPALTPPPGTPPTPSLDEKGKPIWTLGRIHNMSLRYTSKILLSHIYTVWCEFYNIPMRAPYPIEYKGHTTYISPWDFTTCTPPLPLPSSLIPPIPVRPTLDIAEEPEDPAHEES